MKTRRLAWTLFLLGGLAASRSYSFDATPQRPQDVNIPIDVSRSDSSITANVKITEHRVYEFYLNSYYKDRDDLYRVMALTGDGSRRPDGQYAHPGIIVPLHVRVVSSSGAVIYDTVRNAQGHDIHGFGQHKDGYFSRSVGGIELRPGTYRIEANTVKDTPEFSGTTCTFHMTWYFNTKPLAD